MVVRSVSESLEIPKASHLIGDAVTNELLPQLLLRLPRTMLVLAGEVRHLVHGSFPASARNIECVRAARAGAVLDVVRELSPSFTVKASSVRR